MAEEEPTYEDDDEVEEMKRRVQEMEEEAEQLKELQESVAKEIDATSGASSAADVGGAVEENSVHISQVDYDAKPEELQEHFASCGTINRVTIMCDKFTGKGKGFAYIEFADKEAVDNALLLNDSVFKGRELKVAVKRVNEPGMKAKGKEEKAGKAKGRAKAKGKERATVKATRAGAGGGHRRRTGRCGGF
eukprot:CAMPEP_0171642664 /NCGR_PEP_ID=MMETSP0990-20121206/32131_1 /TAXON_ID=483369 /ORGANISM="non described non described, Strain CCMP2098" /LENGTH=190 /DNA_ID=CAMNT_0012218011 /DNA_START=97 /DNA_END=670 /DNA_ORIENTATION=+